MMKMRFVLILILGVALAGCGMGFKTNREEVTQGVNEAKTAVMVGFDYGESVATYSASLTEATNALAISQQVAVQENLELKVKHYDFGDLVEAIDGRENTTKKAWILFVNGSAASVGAQDVKVVNGDYLEWKYMAPSYEEE